MTYTYHNDITGRDEIRENGNTIGYYYDNPLTGQTEFRSPSGETTAYRYGGEWRDPGTHEATRPY